MRTNKPANDLGDILWQIEKQDRYVKIPAPGQFRGEGKWYCCADLEDFTKEDWRSCVRTNYLPTSYSKPKE